MKWVLYIFLLLIGFTTLGLWYLQDPGHMEIRWLGYEIQFSVIIGVLGLLILFCLTLCLKSFLSLLLGIPFQWISFFKRGRDKKAKEELLKLLSSFEAENTSEALLHYKRGASALEEDPLFLWISGNLFQKISKYFDAEKCFMALAKFPLTTFLGLKGQIQSAFYRGNTELAYDLLENARRLVPTSPWVLKHLLEAAYVQKDLPKAEKLILCLEDLGYFASDYCKKQISYLRYLQAMQPEASQSEKEYFLKESHKLDPTFIETTLDLAEFLFERGKKREALQILETSWSLKPTQAIGDLYLKIVFPRNEVETYQVASQLVKEKAKTAEDLFLLSRTALHAKLWGEARSHLIELLKHDPVAEAYSLLAILELEEKQDSQAAINWLKQSLLSSEPRDASYKEDDFLMQ